MISELNSVECVTLFVEDLPAAKKFYEQVFTTTPVYEDQNCTVVRLNNLMLNLLKISESSELIGPAKVAGRDGGARMIFTIRVSNVDDVCTQLKNLNVALLNGPINRPWGRRTAAFADPAGHVWEIAHEL
jgi:catechol 2,3-dioxygenase-like lactoylglutathione lyase family enzyme